MSLCIAVSVSRLIACIATCPYTDLVHLSSVVSFFIFQIPFFLNKATVKCNQLAEIIRIYVNLANGNSRNAVHKMKYASEYLSERFFASAHFAFSHFTVRVSSEWVISVRLFWSSMINATGFNHRCMRQHRRLAQFDGSNLEIFENEWEKILTHTHVHTQCSSLNGIYRSSVSRFSTREIQAENVLNICYVFMIEILFFSYIEITRAHYYDHIK